jgi:hypothetical protein
VLPRLHFLLSLHRTSNASLLTATFEGEASAG